MKTSDVILGLVGNTEPFLCHALKHELNHTLMPDAERRAKKDALIAILDWIVYNLFVNNYSTGHTDPPLAVLYNVYIRQSLGEHVFPDGWNGDVGSPHWRAVRDKWCTDYAAFLKEFGL